jgi:hypothetical protein
MQSLTGGSVARRLVSAAFAVKRARAVVLLVVAALAVALIGAGPAAASDGGGGVSWGSFHFTSYGDYMTVHDLQADGYSVTAEATDGRNWWYCTNSNGYAGPAKTCNWDVPEYKTLRVYLYRNGSGDSAGPWYVSTT